jgi:plasmid stabilization system protein ParE
MRTYGFHPEALAEYHDAANFYLEQASPLIAASFLAEVETSVLKILGNPETWRVVEAPGIWRYLIHRFPMRFIIDGNRNITEWPYTRSCTCAANRGIGKIESRSAVYVFR